MPTRPFRLNFATSPTAVLAMAGLCLLAATSVARGDIDAQVRDMIRAADLRQTVVGLMAVDTRDNQTILAVNPDEPMIPASNMKLITTAAALRMLGPDFTFRTELRLVNADLDAADLVIKGDGDPALGDPKMLREQDLDAAMFLDRWVAAARDVGVRRIRTLIIDDRIFDQQFVHPDWPVDQLNRWYCAQVAGLNFHDNCLDLYPEPTVVGQTPIVRMLPEAPFVQVINRAVTDKADTFWISRLPNTNVITYRGKVKNHRTSPVHVTVHDPPMFLARSLARRFALAKIPVDAIRRVELDDELPPGQTLAQVLTPLTDVLARCNKDSQNLFAEALLKRLGYQFTGATGSWSSGAAAVRKFLSDELKSRGAGISIADGSGMSRQNSVSPRLLVDLLAAVQRDEEIGQLFLSSLAVGGEDGTLRSRFEQGMTGRVHAKSGYISQVSCLSGYIVFDAQAPDQKPRVVAFALLFNGFQPPVYAYQLKQIQDELVQLIGRVVSNEALTAVDD